MGSYVYCNKPSQIASALVRLADGSERVERVALYRYAYKPSRGWNAQRDNNQMRVRSGAMACAAAWARAPFAMPFFGVMFDADKGEVYAAGHPGANQVFDNQGAVEVVDDEVAYATRGTIVRWIHLPKGIREGAMPVTTANLPATTVLHYYPAGAGGHDACWVRLYDPAQGVGQPAWTLVHNAAELQAHAARYGVPAVEAPADLRA